MPVALETATAWDATATGLALTRSLFAWLMLPPPDLLFGPPPPDPE